MKMKKKNTKFMFLWFSIILPLFALGCSASYPSERNVIQELNRRNAHLFKVKNLRKTNGQYMEAYGVKMYQFEFEAEIECTGTNATRSSGIFPGMVLGFSGAKCYEIGETPKLEGTMKFEKNAKGWRAVF